MEIIQYKFYKANLIDVLYKINQTILSGIQLQNVLLITNFNQLVGR